MANVLAPFVGRDRELSSLTQRALEVTQTGGRIDLISGEPGIGKTTLISALQDTLAEQNVAVYIGRCVDGVVPPFWPWIGVLRALASDIDIERFAKTAIVRLDYLSTIMPGLFPDLQSTGSSRSLSTAILGDSEKFYIYQAVYEFLKFASLDRAFVLVIEDLHWADAGSCDLLEFLSREITSVPILLACTYRNTDVVHGSPFAATIGSLLAMQETHHTRLVGLGIEAVSELLKNGGDDSNNNLDARDILERTDGNALFVRALIDSMRDGVSHGDIATLPENVRHLVGRYIARLSERELDIISWAAMLGTEYPLSRLVQVIPDGDTDEVIDAIDEANKLNLMQRVIDRSEIYSFRHAIVRDTILSNLSLSRRIRMHARSATILEDLRAEGADIPASELIHHFSQCELVHGEEKISRYAIEAADFACRQHDYDSARALLGRGIEAIVSGNPKLLAILHAKIANVYEDTENGISNDLIEHRSRAITHAIVTNDVEIMRRVFLGAQWPIFVAPQFKAQISRIADKLGECSISYRIRISMQISRLLQYGSADSEISTETLKAAEKARCDGDLDMAARIHSWRAIGFHGAGRFADKLAENRAIRDLASADDAKLTGLIGIPGQIDALKRLRRGSEAADLLHSIIPLCQSYPYSSVARRLLVSLCGQYQVDADWDRFEEHMRYLEALRPSITEPQYRWARPKVWLELDELDKAHAAVKEVIADTSRGCTIFAVNNIPIYVIRSGDPSLLAATMPASERLLAIWASERMQNVISLHTVAIAYFDDDVAAVRSELDRIQPSLLDNGYETTGYFYAALGERDRANDLYLQGLEQKAHDMRDQGWLMYWLARLHWDADRAKATKWFEKSRSHATKYRLKLVLRRLLELEEGSATGRTIQSNRARDIAGLTQREIDVLREVASGKTDAEIAEALFISTKTVSNHVGNILRKTGTANRTEATRFAVDRGIVDDSSAKSNEGIR